MKTSALEKALIKASQATEARGLKIMLFSVPIDPVTRAVNVRDIGYRVLARIHMLTDGVPIYMHKGVTEKTVHESHARNLQLLLDIYKAWIKEQLK